MITLYLAVSAFCMMNGAEVSCATRIDKTFTTPQECRDYVNSIRVNKPICVIPDKILEEKQ